MWSLQKTVYIYIYKTVYEFPLMTQCGQAMGIFTLNLAIQELPHRIVWLHDWLVYVCNELYMHYLRISIFIFLCMYDECIYVCMNVYLCMYMCMCMYAGSSNSLYVAQFCCSFDDVAVGAPLFSSSASLFDIGRVYVFHQTNQVCPSEQFKHQTNLFCQTYLPHVGSH